MSKQCPACGSDRLSAFSKQRRYAPAFGEPVEYVVAMLRCGACEEAFEAQGASAESKRVIEQADRGSVKVMLDDLAARGFTMAYIERVLGLPPRTLARWKSGEVSTGGIALLRIIRMFPWILKVAKSRFSSAAAAATLSEEAYRARAQTGSMNHNAFLSSGISAQTNQPPSAVPQLGVTPIAA